ncbi:dihydrolipoyl dehydrogenase [Mycoplasmopsis bovis]|uniref:dihydrolipoyl dehydrogenase n=1 Tax=Mycoplasmopsis bovis TaxID=28903 RepID=UPI003D2C510E
MTAESKCTKSCASSCEASKSSCASSCASESSCKASCPKSECSQEKVCSSWKDEGLKYEGEVADEFDLIVVGSGPGGYLAAEMAGKAGLKTLIVEKEFWGGVCLNIGCIPTKAMLRSTHTLEEVIHAAKFGVVANLEDLKIDYQQSWVKMHERKAKVVAKLSGGVKFLMKASKVQTEEGVAKFVGAREIEVNGKVYRGKNVILATGSHANRMKFLEGFEKGYESGKLMTSREAINNDKSLPESMVIVGGGVIGVEFAQMYASMGTKVTIIQREDRLLPGIDKEIVDEFAKILKTESKIEVIYGATSTKLEGDENLIYTKDGKEEKITAEVILIATGRVPASEGLAEVGIELGARREVKVDKFLRTNVKGVYAIGDVTNQNMLAHVAYIHAVTAVHHILDLYGIPYDSTTKPVPTCIYTSPEIATVGLTEEQAKEQGLDFFVSKYKFATLGKAIAAEDTKGLVKLIVLKDGHIVGASLMGPNVTDYVAELALAIEKRICVTALTHVIHPHPTFNEIIWEAARSALSKLTAEKLNERKNN